MSSFEFILAITGHPAFTAPINMEDGAMSALSSLEARVIGASLAHLTTETKRNSDALQQIGESLHVLTRLEVTQTDIAERLKEGSMKMTDHEKRIQSLEQEMPGLREMRKWGITAILAVLGMLGTALVKIVIIDIPKIPTQPPPHQQQSSSPP